MRRNKFILMVVPAVAFLCLAGCAREMHPIELNDAAAAFNRRLAKAGRDFKGVLNPIEKGSVGDFDVTKAQNSYNNLQQELDKVRAEFNKLKPAKDGTPAQEFYQAYDAFLTGQEAIFKEHFATILNDAKDPGASADAKKAALEREYQRIREAEDRDLKTLQTAQLSFAKAAGFRTLRDRPDPNK